MPTKTRGQSLDDRAGGLDGLGYRMLLPSAEKNGHRTPSRLPRGLFDDQVYQPSGN